MPIDTAVIGTVVMDVTAESVGLQADWKDKQRIDGIRLAIGGDGANQSIRMADLDMSVAITGCVGKDMAGMLAMEALRKRGVDVSHMRESSDRETGTALILLRNDGDRNIFSNNGAHPQVFKEDCAWIRRADIRALSVASLFCLPWACSACPGWRRTGCFRCLRTAESGRFLPSRIWVQTRRSRDFREYSRFFPGLTISSPVRRMPWL